MKHHQLKIRAHCKAAHRSSVQAFTLIELLVVISIISLLIAILLPALGRAREAGQAVLCLSNQRQAGVAMSMYHGDFKGSFIPHTGLNGPNLPAFSETWASWMWNHDYIPDARIYNCPTFTQRGSNASLPTDWTNINADPGSYAHKRYWRREWVEFGYNGYHLGSSLRLFWAGRVDASQQNKPAHLIDVANPTKTILFVDSRQLPSSTDYVIGRYYVNDTFSITSGHAHARHNGAANTIWADGHGSAVRASDPDNAYTSDALTAINDSDNYWDRK